MAKIDFNAFEALGEMIRPPPAPKAVIVKDWAPKLNPAQQRLFDSDSPFVLCHAEKFSGKCRSPDAIIYTAKGAKRLGAMKPDGAGTGLTAIREPVLAFDGTKIIKSVARYFWVEDNRIAMRCEMENGAEIVGSPRHPLWVCHQRPDGTHEFRYLSLSEMAEKKKSGSRFWTPFVGHNSWTAGESRSITVDVPWLKCRECEKKPRARGLCRNHYANHHYHGRLDRYENRQGKTIPITRKIAYMIGAIVGDGMLNVNAPGRGASFSNMDRECLELVSDGLLEIGCHLKHLSGCDYGMYPSAIMKPFIKKLGLSSLCYSKRIPDVIIESPKPVVAAFIRGLYDTDGWVEKSGYIYLCTTSENLGKDVQDILAVFGILCVRRPKKTASGTPAWTLSIMGRHAKKFKDEIGFSIKRKMDRITGVRISSTRPHGYSHGRYGYPDPIRSVVRAVWKKSGVSQTTLENERKKGLVSFGSIPGREKLAAIIERLGGRQEFQPFLLSHNWLEVESLIPCESALYDLSVPGPASFLASGTINHNTWGCCHKLMKHCYDNKNAFGIILTRVGSMSSDGGAWHKLTTMILPEWAENLGIEYKLGHDKQHNALVWIQNRYKEWSMIMNTSAPHGDQLQDRFRGREPSIVFVDELTSCDTPEYFRAIAAQLGRRPLVEDVQQYIGATNPDGKSHWVYKQFFEEPFDEDTGEWDPDYETIYFPAQENKSNLAEGYAERLRKIYAGDEVKAQWMIDGIWMDRPSGEGLFREIYRPEIHVRPLGEDHQPHRDHRILPAADHPIILGLDPGSVHNAFVFKQYLPVETKMRWVIFDEIVTLRKRISYPDFIPMVMRRMKFWRERVNGGPERMSQVWISDNSAYNQFRAAQGSYDVLEIEKIYEANRHKYGLEPLGKIKQAPKFNGSVLARVNILQQKLNQDEIIISAGCKKVHEMLLHLEAVGQKAGEPFDPEAATKPKRSDYLHVFDALTYPMLSHSITPGALIPDRSSTQTLVGVQTRPEAA